MLVSTLSSISFRKSLPLLCALITLTSPACAFAPGFGSLFFPATKSHAQITRDALQQIYLDLGYSDLTPSMMSARETMVVGNMDIDKDQKQSALHADAENFAEAQAVIQDRLKNAVDQVTAGNYESARTNVGKALHTLQDFYSHSNWVELGNTTIHPQFGRAGFPEIPNVAAASEATCLQAPPGYPCFAGNLITWKLTSGYYVSVDGFEDRRPLPGKCRHGGFFDKSEGLGGINKDSGLCSPSSSIATLFGVYDSPHNEGNPMAAKLATDATVQLFRDLSSRMTSEEFAALLGISVSGGSGFAIDTTGSMAPYLAKVKTQVTIRVLEPFVSRPPYVLSPFNDPSVGPLVISNVEKYFLDALSKLTASGGDDCPELAMTGLLKAVGGVGRDGRVWLFTDASAKDAKRGRSVADHAIAKNVTVFAGMIGTCPGETAVASGINANDPRSLPAQTTAFPAGPAYMLADYDKSLMDVANRSGGQVLLLRGDSLNDVSVFSDLSVALARGDISQIENRQFTVTSPRRDPLLIFPVESQIKRLIVVVSAFDQEAPPPLDILYDPSGRQVVAGPGVEVAERIAGRMYYIDNPAAGQWGMAFTVPAKYSAVVYAQSNLALSRFQYVERGGRPGHEGYYPSAGMPRPGGPVKASALLSGTPSSVSFEYRDPAGTVLSRFNLSDAVSDTGVLLGDTTVPSTAYRIYAVGNDVAGYPFQRLLPPLMSPQTFSVTPAGRTDLGRGQNTALRFIVTNSGPPRTFNLEALDDQEFVRSVEPASAVLQTGQSVIVKIVLTVPADAVVGSSDSVVLSAFNSADASQRNFAMTQTSVVAPKLFGDVNRDGKVNCSDLLLISASLGQSVMSKGFNPEVDVDSDGAITQLDYMAIKPTVMAADPSCRAPW